MGWLIDPEERSVFVYFPDKSTDVFDQLEARLPIPEFARDISLTVGDLFGWLME
ncbi:Uma2 family endonuclease [Fischerella sp. PCC 9605]|uniref:Uma2 family endonuclease n=1 Tax=Fischerella sp. PCC 9605 TaxID=1173024 RepID=UPI0004AF48B7